MRKDQMKAAVVKLESLPRSGEEQSESERSERLSSLAVSKSAQVPETEIPDPEVRDKAIRRRFTSEYKLRILQEAESCDFGGVAALLRREGLYSSNLTQWRQQRDHAALISLRPHKRGRKSMPRNPLTAENERLQRENRKLQQSLRKAEIIIDVQKKLCDVLGLTVPPIDPSEDEE